MRMIKRKTLGRKCSSFIICLVMLLEMLLPVNAMGAEDTYTASTNDGKLTITVKNADFPEGSTIHISEISNMDEVNGGESSIRELLASSGREYLGMKTYCMEASDAEGNMLQPEHTVTVEFEWNGISLPEGSNISRDDSIKIYQIQTDDTGEVSLKDMEEENKIDVLDTDEANGISCLAVRVEEFSELAVVWYREVSESPDEDSVQPEIGTEKIQPEETDSQSDKIVNDDEKMSQSEDKTSENSMDMPGDESEESGTEIAEVMQTEGRKNNGIAPLAEGSFHVIADIGATSPGQPESKYIDVFHLSGTAGDPNAVGTYGYVLRWIRDDPEPRRYTYCFEIGKGSSPDHEYGPDGKWTYGAEYSALAYAMTNGAQRVRELCTSSEYSTGEWWVDYAVTQLAAHLIIDYYEGNSYKDPKPPRINLDLITPGTMTYWAAGGTVSRGDLADIAKEKAKKLFKEAVKYGDELNNGYLDKVTFDVNMNGPEMQLVGNYYEMEVNINPNVYCPDGKNYQSVFKENTLSVSLGDSPIKEARLEKTGLKAYLLKVPKASVKAGESYTFTVSAQGQFDRQKVVNYLCSDRQSQSMGYWETTTEQVSDSASISLKVPKAETVKFGVKKVWSGDNGNGRPDYIDVGLWRKVEGGQGEWLNDKRLNAGNNWQIAPDDCWLNLPKYNSEGKSYIYYAKERNVPAGYIQTYTESSDSGTTLTITNTREKVKFGVKKVWSGDSTDDRPDYIDVGLWRKVESGQGEWLNDKRLNAGNNWQIAPDNCWKDLPKYNSEGKLYIYYAKERNVPAGYVETYTESSEDNAVLTITNKKTKTAELTVKKVNPSGSSLGGATFKLTKGSLSGKEITGNSAGTGIIKYTSIEDGTYYLTESSAPSGYELPKGYITFIAKNGEISKGSHDDYGSLGSFSSGNYTYILKNTEIKPALVLAKQNIQGNALKGAQFQLRKGSLSGTIITGQSYGTGGMKYQALESGTYYLKEIKSPDGYKLPDGYVAFIVQAGKITMDFNGYGSLGSFSGESSEFLYTLKNEAIQPELAVRKTNIAGSVLSGAVFKLTKGSLTGTEVSGKSAGIGIIKYTNLGDGTYYLKEETAPGGYQLPSGYVTFVVKDGKISKGTHDDYGSLGSYSSGSYTYTLSNMEIKPTLTLAKYDPDGNALEGAVFELRKGSLTGTVITGSPYGTGGMKYRELESATYYLKEIESPDGYKLPDGYVTFTVKGGKITMDSNGYGNLGSFSGMGNYEFLYMLTNEKQTAELTVKKIDPSGTALNGAVFKLSKDSLDGEEMSATSTGTGVKKYTNLGDGTYYLKEISSPNGYQLPAGYVTFIVKTGKVTKGYIDGYGNLGSFDGNSYVYTLKNKQNNAVIKIKKTDSITGKSLAGATFTLRVGSIPNTSTGIQVTTGKDGIAVFDIAPEDFMKTFTIQETATPQGYVECKDYCIFSVGSDGSISNMKNMLNGSFDGNTYTYTIKNTRKTTELKLIKKDRDKDVRLKGAEFTLYDNDFSTVYAKKETDANGAASYTGLQPGHTYYLKETRAPAGYQQPDSKGYAKFIVDENAELKLEENLYDSLGTFDGSTYSYTMMNERKENGMLPDTGGAGTNGFTFGGMAFILTSLFMMIYSRKKRTERTHRYV